GPSAVIDVRVDEQWGKEAQGISFLFLVLRVPRAGIEHRESFDEHTYCHGHRFPADNRLDVDCGAFASGAKLHFRVRNGVFFISPSGSSEDGARTAVLGAVAIPCPAQVAWPRVHWPNPKWKPYGDTAACRYRQDLCEDRCTESFTDARGEFTEEGAA